MTALTWNGWLTCADCSSLGLDKATGQQPFPVSGSCSSCGGPWPRRPQDFVTAARDEVIRTVREWQRAVGKDSMRRIKQESGEDQEPAATLAVMEALEALETLEAAIPKPLSGKELLAAFDARGGLTDEEFGEILEARSSLEGDELTDDDLRDHPLFGCHCALAGHETAPSVSDCHQSGLCVERGWIACGAVHPMQPLIDAQRGPTVYGVFDEAVSGPAYLHPGGRLAVTNAQGGVDSYRVRIEGPWEDER